MLYIPVCWYCQNKIIIFETKKGPRGHRNAKQNIISKRQITRGKIWNTVVASVVWVSIYKIIKLYINATPHFRFFIRTTMRHRALPPAFMRFARRWRCLIPRIHRHKTRTPLEVDRFTGSAYSSGNPRRTTNWRVPLLSHTTLLSLLKKGKRTRSIGESCFENHALFTTMSTFEHLCLCCWSIA